MKVIMTIRDALVRACKIHGYHYYIEPDGHVHIGHGSNNHPKIPIEKSTCCKHWKKNELCFTGQKYSCKLRPCKLRDLMNSKKFKCSENS